MNKRGIDAMGFLVGVALTLLLFVVSYVVFIKPAITNTQTGLSCTSFNGVCKPSCDPDTEIMKTTCLSGGICCAPIGGSGNGTGGSAGGTDSSVSLQSLPNPIVLVKYGSLQNPSMISIISGISAPGTTNGDNIQVTIQVPKYVPPTKYDSKNTASISNIVLKACNDAKATKPTDTQFKDTSVVCDYANWSVGVTLETVARKVIANDSVVYGFSSAGVLELKPSSSSSADKHITVTKLSGGSESSYQKSTYITVDKESLNVALQPKFYTDFADQTMYLVVTVYKNNESVGAPQRIAISPTYPVKINLQTGWARERTASVYCDSNKGIKCDKMAFKISDSEMCTDMPTESVNTPMSTVNNYIYIINPDGSLKSTTPYSNMNACMAALSSSTDISQQSILLNLLGISSQLGLSNEQKAQAMALLPSTNVGAGVQCREKKDIKSIPTEFDKFYLTDTFNQDIQTGTINLAQASMAGKYLCAYGHDQAGTGWKYNSGKGKKIMIDRNAPIVNVTFNPLTMNIVYSCSDGTIVGDTNESGCDVTHGEIYINKAADYIQALFASPQSATKWCPTTGYSVITNSVQRYDNKTGTVYNKDGLMVLCVQGKDKAGNVGYSMVNVYNGYQILAGIIAMEQQKKLQK